MTDKTLEILEAVREASISAMCLLDDYMFLDIGWGVWCLSIMGSTPTATNRRTTRENAV